MAPEGGAAAAGAEGAGAEGAGADCADEDDGDEEGEDDTSSWFAARAGQIMHALGFGSDDAAEEEPAAAAAAEPVAASGAGVAPRPLVPSEKYIADAQGLPRTVKPVRTREEIRLFLWCVKQPGVLHRPAQGAPSIRYAQLNAAWAKEVKRQWEAKEATPQQLRLKTEQLLRRFRDKLDAKMLVSEHYPHAHCS